VVEEHNITAQISNLRKILGPRTIATIPGRGYRFTALLDEGTPESAGASNLASSAAGDVDSASLWTQPTIAVFPFEDLSETADHAHFADGITEDLVTALSCWRRFP
jgi:hypothetical protein